MAISDTALKGFGVEDEVLRELRRRGVHQYAYPRVEGDTYDLIIDVNKKLYTIQIKCAYVAGNSVKVETKKYVSGEGYRNYKPNDFDFMIVGIVESCEGSVTRLKEIYVLPGDFVISYPKRRFTFRPDAVGSRYELEKFKNAFYLIPGLSAETKKCPN